MFPSMSGIVLRVTVVIRLPGQNGVDTSAVVGSSYKEFLNWP